MYTKMALSAKSYFSVPTLFSRLGLGLGLGVGRGLRVGLGLGIGLGLGFVMVRARVSIVKRTKIVCTQN